MSEHLLPPIEDKIKQIADDMKKIDLKKVSMQIDNQEIVIRIERDDVPLYP
jgi:hypothetical protein